MVLDCGGLGVLLVEGACEGVNSGAATLRFGGSLDPARVFGSLAGIALRAGTGMLAVIGREPAP